MEFTYKDIIYIGVYVATVTGLFTQVRLGLQQLKVSVDSINNILFLEKGGLNVLTVDQCKTHQDVIHSRIRREADLTGTALRQLYFMNQNITRIMVHMKVEPIIDPINDNRNK